MQFSTGNKLVDKQDSEVKRKHWSNRAEFFLATLGYSIGMGSLTRFPYIVMKNGGGAFLIPWLFAILIGGIPLFCLELALGQFSGLSPLTMWSLSPALKGIGTACSILSAIVSIYYCMQLSWSLFYLINCFTVELPWSSCSNSWNSEKCCDPSSQTNCTMLAVINGTFNSTVSINSSVQTQEFILPSEEFFNNVILGLNNSNIDSIGNLRWQLVLCAMATWLFTFLCLIKGVRSLGKVVYITATVPYLLITVLIIRGVTLDGAAEGLSFYLKPNFTILTDHNVWIEASLQVFFSLGPGWGGLITMASYNKFHHGFEKDAILISFGDAFTALYGGIAVFSALGFMAKKSNMPISRFAASGFGLSYVVFPQVIAEMPGSTLWSILFFVNLYTMGIDTQFGMFDTVISGVMDMYPVLRKHEILVTAFISALFFLVGLPFATEGGMYLYVLLDWYAHVITLSVVSLLEILIVAYVYGWERFSYDIRLMLGKAPNLYWKICWMFLTPVFMALLTFFGLWNYRPPSYQGYQYPDWSISVGWVIASVSFAPIPIFILYAFIKSPHKSIKKRLVCMFTPTSDWVPAKKELVDEYRQKWFGSSNSSDRMSVAPDSGTELQQRENIKKKSDQPLLQ